MQESNVSFQEVIRSSAERLCALAEEHRRVLAFTLKEPVSRRQHFGDCDQPSSRNRSSSMYSFTHCSQLRPSAPSWMNRRKASSQFTPAGESR